MLANNKAIADLKKVTDTLKTDLRDLTEVLTKKTRDQGQYIMD